VVLGIPILAANWRYCAEAKADVRPQSIAPATIKKSILAVWRMFPLAHGMICAGELAAHDEFPEILPFLPYNLATAFPSWHLARRLPPVLLPILIQARSIRRWKAVQ
jgi:hypothetical protein